MYITDNLFYTFIITYCTVGDDKSYLKIKKMKKKTTYFQNKASYVFKFIFFNDFFVVNVRWLSICD